MKRTLFASMLLAGMLAQPFAARAGSSAWTPEQQPQSRITAVAANGDTMEVVKQVKSGGEWTNDQRVVVTTGTDFHSVENFVDSLLNVTDLPEEILLSFLDHPFEAGFYMLSQDWSGGEWEHQYRLITSANTAGRMETLTLQYWNDSWQDGVQMEYAYDAESRVRELRLKVSSGGPLQYALRMTRSYNENGRVGRDMIAIYTGGNWQDALRITYTYNADGNLTERVSEIDAQVAWLGYHRIQNSYDGNQNLTQRITQRGEMTGIQTSWENIRKELMTYDGQGNMTEHVYQAFRSQSWTDSLRRTYQYNASNRQTHVLVETSSGGSWENDSQTQTLYENGNAVEEIHQDWQGSWINQERITTTYDVQNRPVIMIIYDWLDPAWEEEEQYLFNYESQTGVENDGASTPADFQLSNYPNPFNPATTIRVELGGKETVTLTVLDVRGRLVRTLIHDRQMHAGKHEIVWNGRDDSGLAAPSGVYLIRLQGRSRTRTERCLLLK